MNGSGNLVITCALKDISLEIQAGDGTFNGPGEYSFAPSKLDGGSFRLSTTDGVYDATMVSPDVRTGCIVEVTTAPVGDVPKGSAIVGTFTCTAIPRFPWIDPDPFSNQSDGVFDFTNGTFNLSVR
jgi:hypothetical protein